MVGPDGVLPLPWLAPLLARTLTDQRGHALLLHGPAGVGQFEFATTVAQAWLCLAEDRPHPCGVCTSCRQVQSHTHPDLLVLLPELLQLSLGWASPEEPGERAPKAKPSKEIKVEAVRAAVSHAQTTASGRRGKVVVIFPAERMNSISAHTLLKTLEEPAGDARFLLATGAPDALLPTIRSRCQAVRMDAPTVEEASAWLRGQGVADPAVLLAAAGGQPQEALAWHADGVDAALWLRLPALVASGSSAALAAWPLPRLVDALQKLCHDVACVAAGALPRYFPASALRAGASAEALAQWMAELNRVARHAEHPWNAGLMTESLVQQGRRAIVPTP